MRTASKRAPSGAAKAYFTKGSSALAARDSTVRAGVWVTARARSSATRRTPAGAMRGSPPVRWYEETSLRASPSSMPASVARSAGVSAARGAVSVTGARA